ncbi:hypothetical protein [Paenibacillus sp. PL2-23]|uniref:hypothetical protein n=1 Tax=Paenibacillus sp. PL2-23 TaxID=2100729 RepID=UPI0030F53DEC
MNQYSGQPVQPFQGGQQSYLNQNQSQFQPVQSHYQGQLSQPTFNQTQTNGSIVSNQAAGYGAQAQMGYQHAAPAYQSYSQPAVTNHSFISHQPVQSYASSPATAFGNVGPVIAHTGYQAGQNTNTAQSHSQYGQHSYYQPVQAAFNAMNNQSMTNQSMINQSMAQHQGNANAQYGMTQTHSSTGLNPVYNATHAYDQAGPVISKVGWQASSSNASYTR